MATTPRKVRSGRTLWQDRRARAVPHGPLTRDIETEVLVVGAGITGALIADALTTAGLEVVVIDKRGLAQGSTAATTALVQYEIDAPLTRLARKIGKSDAVRAWRRSRLAVEALAARFEELRLPGAQRRASLYLAGNVLDRDALWREHEARRASGLVSRYLPRKLLHRQFGISRDAALLGYGSLLIEPRRAALALLAAAAANGAKIFAPTEATDVEPGRAGVGITTAAGPSIRCRSLVFATGYEVPHGVPRRQHKITSTWVIATVPQQRHRLWSGQCIIWEASDRYLYVRTTSDGRVICGGEDEDIAEAAAREKLLPRKTETLRRKLARLLPKLDTTIDYAWTGAFGETTTALPIIGPVPGMPHCWIALGYGGNGITYASIAADVIVGALTGCPDVDADLYRFASGRRR